MVTCNELGDELSTGTYIDGLLASLALWSTPIFALSETTSYGPVLWNTLSQCLQTTGNA